MDLLNFQNLGVHLSLTGSAGALLVVLAGWWFNQRMASAEDEPQVPA
jgi:hypothetical protein